MPTVIAAEPELAKQPARLLARVMGLFVGLALLLASVDLGHAQPVRFAEQVNFKLVATFAPTTEVGSLTTKVREGGIQMTLSNVAAAGADKGQELITLIDKSNLALISSTIVDQTKGTPVRVMQRKVGTSILDNNKAEIFEYKEFKDGKITNTEPYVEFKVVDFVSVMFVAADAIERKEGQPIDLSMLRDRSVVRVTLKITGRETVGGRAGTVVRVAPPNNPSGGISYVISQTNDGAYYPARISVETSSGLVQLDGLPQ